MATFYPCKKPLTKVRLFPPVTDPKLIVSNEASGGSFVNSCASAYNNHHHLILTPDAVWLAIMTQFSTYLEKYAEELRGKFVSFEGRRELTVYGYGNLSTANYPVLIKDMVFQISKNIKDPSISAWVVPDFTTTTESDRVVGSIVLMAAMKKYFGYKMCLCCGLPAVTLLGTVEDWQSLKARAERLVEFDNGEQYMTKWHRLLAPVLEQFIISAQGRPDLHWWNQIVNHISGGSGPSYYSGWITTFSVFDNNGEWVGDQTSVTIWGNVVNSTWPIVDTSDVSLNEVTVNVTVDDNGQVFQTVFTAGVGGFKVVEESSVMPVASWRLSLQ